MASDVTQMPMNPELVAACNALGYREGDKYMKEPYCLETLKDLIRFLRREDDTCDIRRQLGAAQILQNDLIPIVSQYSRQSELLETCIRLMVNLTQPVDLCFSKPEMKGDKAYHSYALEILSHQQAYKEAFSDEDFMACLAERLKKLLEKPWERRREDDTLLMERILVLLRNILHVPADPNAEKRTDDDASVHDRVLWGMNTSGMDKLILYIASSEGEQHWCIHAAEIISRMLREQSPEFIAKAGVSTASTERKKEMAELEAIREREREEKRARQMKLSSRHSRFGGTFQVKNLKSISDYDVIYHRKLPKDVNSISFELDKPPLKRPKHRLPMQDMTLMRRSTLSIRLFLKDFCSLFLENCYNHMMYNVKDHILHQRAQENDDSYYLWTMRFFMEFNRYHQFRVDLISETFSIQSFHYVQMQILKYQEMMTTDKNEVVNWARRLHLALKAYRELLLTLNAISNHPDEAVRESAKVVESNVFYVIEYREILLTLLRRYTDIKNTRNFLMDLVDTAHLYLKMLENYCKGKKNVFVQKKKRKKQKRRKTKRTQEQGAAAASREAELNESWDNIAGDLSAMLQGREDIPENVVPFDAASEQPIEEQRADTMVRIQHCLHNGQAGDGIALLRAAREVWPNGDIFGAADIAPEDEFMALREIHFTNLNAERETTAATEEWPEEEMDDEEDEELLEENQHRAEEEFHFGLFVNQFSHHEILKNYVHLLDSFRTNTPHINHCIIKMLHRVAVDCQKAPKLFQISLFHIFHQLLNDPIAKTSQYKEIVKFAHFILRQFFAIVPDNPKIFMELFFWKDNKEIFELTEGYGSAVRQSTGGDIGDWDEDLNKELTDLFNQFREVQGPKDAVDHIMEKISDESKTRKQIVRQLVNLDLIGGVGDMKRVKGVKRVAIWREEQVQELKDLFAEHREADDIMGSIINDMIEPRPRSQLVEKLLELNLIQDKKEVQKKRIRGAQRRRRGKVVEEEAFIDDNDENDIVTENLPGDGEEKEEGEKDWEEEEEEGSETDGSGGDADSHDDETDQDREDGEEDVLPTKENMQPLMNKLQKKGFRDQILWIQEGLRVRADDREKDANDMEAVPIVPLEEKYSRAVANKLFQKFLRKLGMTPPLDHQETFWRIPGHLSPESLRGIADAIEPKEETEADKKKSKRHEILEEMAKKKKEKQKKPRRKRMGVSEALEKVLAPGGIGNENDEDATSESKMNTSSSKSRIKRPLDSGSSSSESDSEPLGNIVAKKLEPAASNPSKRSRVALQSDSEDEPLVTREKDDTPINNKEVTDQNGNKSQETVNKPSKKATVLVSDDSDSDDDVPVGVLVQRRAVLLESDDSDEDS